MKRKPRTVAAAAVLVAVVAVVAIGAFGGSNGAQDEADEGATALASVEQGRLASRVSDTGTLGYAAQPDGTPYSVVNQASGAYTQLPSAGDEIGSTTIRSRCSVVRRPCTGRLKRG
jgi:hypothetical protein